MIDEDWYYSIELTPGTVTPGKHGDATALTRRMLAKCDLTGARCLDIGPMEGMIPAVMARRGAASITAIDVTLDHTDKIETVKAALGFDFDLHAPLPLTAAPTYLRERGIPAFDVVVFSGVLYHVLDVTAALGAVRNMVRPGGLVIVESWIVKGADVAAHFNAAGRFTSEPNTFWFLTVGATDYLLRFFGLQPLDCAYYEGPGDTLRLATVCRAHEGVAPGADEWMTRAATGSADRDFHAREALPAQSYEPVRCSATGADLRHHVATQPLVVITDHEMTLWLSDRG